MLPICYQKVSQESYLTIHHTPQLNTHSMMCLCYDQIHRNNEQRNSARPFEIHMTNSWKDHESLHPHLHAMFLWHTNDMCYKSLQKPHLYVLIDLDVSLTFDHSGKPIRHSVLYTFHNNYLYDQRKPLHYAFRRKIQW